MDGDDFMTFKGAARALGVSVRHAHRLADAGAIAPVARGLVDSRSVDRYLYSQRQGRTRAWAEHTAWGAIALLAGQDADWIGATQTSRLRGTLRKITDTDELVTRLRDRAQVRTFLAHRAALPDLQEIVASADLQRIGMAASYDERADGYLPAGDLEALIKKWALRPDPNGKVTLRVTGFDFSKVRELVGTSTVAALDAATSIDPRVRGVGRRTLEDLLAAYR
jgi:hypothetical protein